MSEPRLTRSPGLERRGSNSLVISLNGPWLATSGIPGIETIERELTVSSAPQSVEFSATHLEKWDSSLLSFLLRCDEICRRHQIQFKSETLPKGIQRLLQMAQATAGTEDAVEKAPPVTSLARIGNRTFQAAAGMHQGAAFLGELMIATGKLLRGRAQFRWPDAVLIMQQCGPWRSEVQLPAPELMKAVRTPISMLVRVNEPHAARDVS